MANDIANNMVETIHQLENELAEAKRLLKAMVDQMAQVGDVCDCIHSQNCPLDVCDETSLSQSKLPNATNLKEKFETERNSQKENSWAKIRVLIENAMKEGKGYVTINPDTYKNIPLRELSHEIKKAKYKLRDNTCGLSVKYCYNMGYSLIICWE